jgi:ribosomal protein L19
MDFFKKKKIIKPLKKNRIFILRRMKRVNPISEAEYFAVGDVLNTTHKNRYVTYGFEGLCICLRRKNFYRPDITIISRNILVNIGVESTLSHFYNRAYRLCVVHYKRKRFDYKRAKIYNVRNELNRASRVK